MILMRRDMLDQDRDSGVKTRDEKEPLVQRLVMCS
jgi:hypothetical protein